MIEFLVWLLVLAVVFMLIFWVIGQMQLGEPARTIVLAIFGLIALLVLLNALFRWTGRPLFWSILIPIAPLLCVAFLGAA